MRASAKSRRERTIRPAGRTEKVMRTWLEHDPVAFVVLIVGIAAVELLALAL